ncbi:Alpha-monoglucosyldiacylglycerol synthase [Planococcus massiliensis]|uniref:Alpha-monoglucosyldiacylglycerol synthase n=1 Tax=Planococcus massiliensis TaxID=1499687 RepID=A0A098EK87_9BACL|nr:glycosyltransferase family 4 protein [Planococcus massiliensis]CEG22769.1 Alpha-monoglucosyldiacylglycerol synthase [Planococcus massiliensis]
MEGYHVTMLTFADVPKESSPFPHIIVKRSRYYPVFEAIKRLNLVKDHAEADRTEATFFAKFWNRIAYREGIELASELQPDLIYGYEIFSTRAAKRLSDKLGIPCITRFQGTELGLLLDSPKFYEAHDYINGTAVQADLIIMANDGTDGDRVLKRLGIEMDRVRFWPNGLHDKEKYLNEQPDEHYRAKMGLPEGAFVICTANRFVEWKRLDRIVKLMELLEKKPSPYLIAIGDGPEKSRVMEMVRSKGLENIRLLDALDHEEAIYHIANADLYITLNESGNLGNSILEALALGTAVCTLKNDSVCRVLEDGANAILFDEMDGKRIADGLAEWIGQDEKLLKLALAGRQYADEKLLSWPERMKLEIREIDKLLG